jgi:hypothetical protein
MNISTLHELKVAKMQCRYEIKLQERALQTGMRDLKSVAQASLKRSLQFFAKELAVYLAKNLILHGQRKRK